MIAIPAPTMLEMDNLTANLIGCGLIVVGVSLLSWGRLLGRAAVMIGCGVGGYFMATGLPMDIPYFPLIARQFVFVFVMLAFGYVFERVFWGALAAVLLAAAAATVRLQISIVPLDPNDSAGVAAFAHTLWNKLTQAFPTSWEACGVGLLAPSLAMATILLLVAMLRPRWIRVLMTSILGAAAVAAGLAVIVCQLLPRYWTELWARLVWILAAAGALAILGMIVQFLALALAKSKPDMKDTDAKTDATKTPTQADK